MGPPVMACDTKSADENEKASRVERNEVASREERRKGIIASRDRDSINIHSLTSKKNKE